MMKCLLHAVVILTAVLVHHRALARRGPQASYWRNPKTQMRFGAVVETLLDPDHYHKYIRPDINLGKPVNVNVTVSVTSLDRISDNDMEYTITFTLQQLWRDSRLDGTKSVRDYSQVLTMDGSLGNRIWVPDTYIVNSHTSFIHDVTTRNGLIRLYPNGTVLYVLRITSRVSCPMSLHKYPMDEQMCRLTLESWSFAETDLEYKWSGKEKCGPDGSVTGVEKVVLSQFNITKCLVYHTLHQNILGNHSQLILEFHLKRNMLFFLMQTYLPSVLLVILSWISFWINMKSVPARVGLGATTVLSMTTLMIGVYNSGPRSTSYIKAVDFYVCVCYGFIFAALMEYAGAHFAVRSYGKKAEQLSEGPKANCPNNNRSLHNILNIESNTQDPFFSYNTNCNSTSCARRPQYDVEHSSGGIRGNYKDRLTIVKTLDGPNRRSESLSDMSLDKFGREERSSCDHRCHENPSKLNKIENYKNRAVMMEKIDQYSRILFPTIFIAFNIVYWWVYLTMDERSIYPPEH